MSKKGYAQEKRVMEILKKRGKLCERTSGSHGAHDITVTDKKTRKLEYYLQVKSLKKSVFFFSSYPNATYEWVRLYKRWKDIGIPSYFWFSFRRGMGKKIIDKRIKVNTPTPPKKVTMSD